MASEWRQAGNAAPGPAAIDHPVRNLTGGAYFCACWAGAVHEQESHMPSNVSVVVTIVRDQLTRAALATLDGALPLAPGSVVELTDGRRCRVVSTRLTLRDDGASHLILDVQGGYGAERKS